MSTFRPLLFVFVALITSACFFDEKATNKVHLTELGFSIQLPGTAEIFQLDPITRNYQQGIRVVIHSVTNEEFMKQLQERRYEFFGLEFYKPIKQHLDKQLITQICHGTSPVITNEYCSTPQNFCIQYIERCTAGHVFALIRGDEIYKIITSPDTSDFEAAWESVKTISFD